MTLHKLAIIGGGINSAVGRAHLAAARMDGRWEVIGGMFSHDADQCALSANAYGVKPFLTVADIITSEAECVVILTPTPTHFHLVRTLINFGMPVICEKSLAMTSQECDELFDWRDKMNGFLAVVYNYSGYPMVRAMRKLIEDGVIGKVNHFVAEMPQEGFLRSRGAIQSWRRKDDDGCPMIHLDLTVHLHQLLHYLTGAVPLSVAGMERSDSPIGVVDSAVAMVKCEGGESGCLSVSKTSLGSRNGLQLKIYGTEGSFCWNQSVPDLVVFADRHGTTMTIDRSHHSLGGAGRFKPGHPTGFVEALGYLYEDFADCLMQFKQTGNWTSREVFGAELAYGGLRLCEAIHRSSVTGRWEEV